MRMRLFGSKKGYNLIGSNKGRYLYPIKEDAILLDPKKEDATLLDPIKEDITRILLHFMGGC